MSTKITCYLIFMVLITGNSGAQVRGDSLHVTNQDQADSVVVPEGIRYRSALANVNAAARRVIEELFLPGDSGIDVLRLFLERPLVCGPFLWREIRLDEKLAKLEFGEIVFHMPVVDSSGQVVRVNEAEGKGFQSKQEVQIFWRAFVKRTDFAGLKIRRLNPNELAALWVMVPFDIEEPVFILDSVKHKILVMFESPENPKIMWIDEFRDIRWQSEADAKSP